MLQRQSGRFVRPICTSAAAPYFNPQPKKPLEKAYLFKRFGLIMRAGSAAAAAVGSAAAFAAVVGKLLLGHHRCVGVVAPLACHVVGVIRHAHHQVGSQLGCFPSLMEALFQLMLHSQPRSLRRRFRCGIPAGFRGQSASQLCGLSGLPEGRKSPLPPPRPGRAR